MNKYEIIGIVGEGAYGIVYKAKNKETGDIGKWVLDEKSPSNCGHEKIEEFQREILVEIA
jgi:serine/threonine protein kinase